MLGDQPEVCRDPEGRGGSNDIVDLIPHFFAHLPTLDLIPHLCSPRTCTNYIDGIGPRRPIGHQGACAILRGNLLLLICPDLKHTHDRTQHMLP